MTRFTIKSLSVISDLCDIVFSRNSDLKFHLATYHQKKCFKCEKCEMSFVLKWRLQKHVGKHEEKKKVNMKFCHYFNNDKDCSFETLDCMIKHQNAPQCKYDEKCLKTLCQFKHKEEKTKINAKNVTLFSKMKSFKISCL